MPRKGTRRAAFAILSIVLGLFAALFLLAFAEVVVRVLKPENSPPSRPRPGSAKQPAAKRPTNPQPLADAPTHIPVHLPPPLQLKGTDEYAHTVFKISDVTGPPTVPFYTADGDLGLRPAPGYSEDVKRFFGDGSVAFSAHYTIDAKRRRLTPGQESGPRAKPLVFLGCSFTFGEGLNDDQTLPAVAARLEDAYRVYNYGISGGGPANAVRLVQRADFGDDLAKSNGAKVVYVFYDHQLNRVAGALDVYRAPGWINNLPYYSLGSQGELESHGMLSDGRPWLTDKLFRLMAQSRLLTYFNVMIPSRPRPEDFQLTAALFDKLRADVVQRLGGADFYVMIYPGSKAGHTLVPYLDKKGISTLDYSDVDLTDYVPGPITLPDWHPSARTDAFLARQILTDLNVIP